MKKSPGIAAVALALTLSFAPALRGDSEANHGGEVTNKVVTYGISGMINRIDLTINTLDGLTWTATCRRANSNLGWCDPVNIGNNIQVQGIIPYCHQIEVTYIGIKMP